MEANLSKLVELAGSHHKYQHLIIALSFLIWLNATILGFTLGLLENPELVSYYDAESNSTVVESLSYSICNSENLNYTTVETYKYSWVIDLGIQCEKLKVSLLGTFSCFGLLMGALTSAPLGKCFGQKKVLIASSIVFCLDFLMLFFFKNYYCYLCVAFIANTCCNIMSYSTAVLIPQIIQKRKKSFFMTMINSALGLGGIFYVCLFIIFKAWKPVFIICICFQIILAILVFFFFLDSFQRMVNIKDFDNLLKALKFIAKINGRIEIFTLNFEKEEYQNAFKGLKGEFVPLPTSTPKTALMSDVTNEKGIEISQIPKTDKIEEEDKKEENKVQTSEGNNNSYEPKSTESNFVPNDSQKNTQNSKEENQNKNQKRESIKVNAFSILKYRSVRYTFLLFCLLWFFNNVLYTGLTIGLKSLPGNIYINSLLLFIAETPSYFVSGFSMNTMLGRKFTLILFTGLSSLCFFLLYILFNHNTPSIVIYLISRFFSMTAFATYYTFSLESYPISIANFAYGMNGACNNLGGVVAPWVIEYINRRLLYLIFGIFGIACTLLMLLLKETRGVQIPDQIKEIQEEEDKLKIKRDIPVVVI